MLSLSKSARNCRRCRNHGIKSEFQGHKNRCKFQLCKCFSCKSLQSKSKAKSTISSTRQENDNEPSDAGSADEKMVVAWMNGEEIKDYTGEDGRKWSSTQPKSLDDDVVIIDDDISDTAEQKNADEPTEMNVEESKEGVEVFTRQPGYSGEKTPNINERSEILKQIKDLHALKVCGALNNQEFQDKKAILLRDFI